MHVLIFLLPSCFVNCMYMYPMYKYQHTGYAFTHNMQVVFIYYVPKGYNYGCAYSLPSNCTLLDWLTLAPASMSEFTTSRYPLALATSNGLQLSCSNTNIIIAREWTSGGECWSIICDRCKHFLHMYNCKCMCTHALITLSTVRLNMLQCYLQVNGWEREEHIIKWPCSSHTGLMYMWFNIHALDT